MRVGVACVMQETNSFAPSCSQMSRFVIERGEAIFSSNRRANTEIGGFLRAFENTSHELVPLYSAWDIAAGPIDPGLFEEISSAVLSEIVAANCDALLMALHGAWHTPTITSCDAELMRRVRDTAGCTVPVFATLDFHANVLPSLLASVNGIVAYRTYPHTDMCQAGFKAASLLQDWASGHKPKVQYLLRLPLLAPPQNSTTEQGPVREALQLLDERLKPVEGVLSSSLCIVQPWLDFSEVGSSVVVAAEQEDSRITEGICEVAQLLWDRRHELDVEWTSAEQLLMRVNISPRPVIVSEGYDATSAGSTGDHPGLLSILYPRHQEISSALFLVDPEAVRIAQAAAEGGAFRANVGAREDNRFGNPIPVEGVVTRLTHGSWTLKGPVFTGRRVSMGDTAVVQCGKLNVVFASRPVLMIDPELFRSQGIEPGDMDVVGVKSPAMYRVGYRDVAGTCVDLDMPGVSRGNLVRCPFRKISRPMFPFDDFGWRASAAAVKTLRVSH